MKIADYKKGAVESLAKLPHGVAALTSLLFGQVACWDLKLRLAPCASTCSNSSLQSPAHVSFSCDNRDSPCERLSPFLPGPLCLMCSLDETPVDLPQTPLFWFELTGPALAWVPQSTLTMDTNKCLCFRPCCLLPASCLDLSVWPLRYTRYFFQDL